MSDKENERLFPALGGDEPENAVTVIESLCMNCEQQGETRLLLTNIPFFKDIVIASFSCPSCGFSNRSVDTAGMMEDEGIRYELRVRNQRDLSRQIIATEVSEMRLPEFDSIFPISQGKLTTIEGTIREVIENLSDTMNYQRATNPELADKLAEFIGKLVQLLGGETEFDWVLDDPRGAAFVENPNAPEPDEHMRIIHYPRSTAQNEKLGIYPDQAGAVANGDAAATDKEAETYDMKDEVVEIPVNCPSCNAPCMNRMKMVDIPHFKQVIIMAVTCDACGYRDNEVKPGAGIAEKGRKITLHVTDITDLSRDLLKSEACSLSVPELELDCMSGTLGGKFSTVEGILGQMRDQLKTTNPFLFGDSGNHPGNPSALSEKLKALVEGLDKAISGEMLDYHLILDDSSGNSYIQNLYAPDPDPELKVEDYDRTEEQNDELGIDTMSI